MYQGLPLGGRMQGDRRRGFGRRGCFEVVLGKDDGTVESDVVLGKVHDGVSWLRLNRMLSEARSR